MQPVDLGELDRDNLEAAEVEHAGIEMGEDQATGRREKVRGPGGRRTASSAKAI